MTWDADLHHQLQPRLYQKLSEFGFPVQYKVLRWDHLNHLHSVADEKRSGRSVVKNDSALWSLKNKQFLVGTTHFQTQLWQISRGPPLMQRKVLVQFRAPWNFCWVTPKQKQIETKSGESKKFSISSTWSPSKLSALLPFSWRCQNLHLSPQGCYVVSWGFLLLATQLRLSLLSFLELQVATIKLKGTLFQVLKEAVIFNQREDCATFARTPKLQFLNVLATPIRLGGWLLRVSANWTSGIILLAFLPTGLAKDTAARMHHGILAHLQKCKKNQKETKTTMEAMGMSVSSW